MVPGIEHRRLVSYDGTELAYQVRGSGPPIVLANGLGGTYAAFRHIYAALEHDYRILCWDYRGLYDSGPPPKRHHLGMDHQVRDLEILLDHEGIDRAVCIGWSMGVQVNFELAKRSPERVAGIVAINGTAGRPFDTAMASRLARHVIPMLLTAAKRQSRLIGMAAQHAVAWDGLVPLMQRFGFVGETLDEEVFRDVAEGVAYLDIGLYCETLAQLGEHDARDVLSSLRVPVLIITGEKDRMTPEATARAMHHAIRGARLVVIAGGTHYTPVEYPGLVTEELLAFLERVPGWEPGGAAARSSG